MAYSEIRAYTCFAMGSLIRTYSLGSDGNRFILRRRAQLIKEILNVTATVSGEPLVRFSGMGPNPSDASPPAMPEQAGA
jgi:hypothetical protein